MKIQGNISLKPYNTFGIDVSGKYFAEFSSVDALNELLEFRAPRTSKQPPQTFILGSGSNILFTKDFDGLVLKNNIQGIKTIHEDKHYIHVQAGAGENWDNFVQHCIKNNMAGVENLSLIPGSVGASPMQNIGAYGAELKNSFHSLEALHLKEKKLVNFTLNDCEFGYRESVFKKKYKGMFAITSVTFRLDKVPVFNTSYGAVEQELEKMGVKELSIKAISDAIIRIRTSKLPNPSVIGNAGSFFKNPHVSANVYNKLKERFPKIVGYLQDNGDYKLAAGWMIEYCGWKGFRRGDAGCHTWQSLVLVNYGNASGKEIFDLSEEILQTVKQRFGVLLEKEVNII